MATQKINRIPLDMVEDRATGKKLNEKLDEVNANLAQTSSQVTDIQNKKADKAEINTLATGKADKTYVDNLASSLASGSPKGTYATLAALQAAFPTGNSNIYLVTADGKWYYWNGSAWAAGGVYQSVGLSDGIVTPEKTAFITVEKSTNVLNLNTRTDGYYIKGDGVLVAAPGQYLTDKIYCKTGDVIRTKNTIGADYYGGCLFDANGNALGRIQISGKQYTVTTANVAYIRLMGYSINGSDALTEMITVNNPIPAQYESYFVNYKLNNDINIIPKTTVISVIAPKNIYVTSNDIQADGYGKTYSADIYLDHMVNENDANLQFNNGKDKVSFASAMSISNSYPYPPIFNNGNVVDKSSKTLTIYRGTKGVNGSTTATVQQISTKSSVTRNKKAFVLCIGDSLTEGVGADDSNTGNTLSETVYWAYIKKFFEQDKIDDGNDENNHNVFMLGQKKMRTIPINYKGVSKTVKVGAEGRSGWTLYSYLRHSTNLNMSQGSWDTLGLGNGSQTDFTGNSNPQFQLIANTCQTSNLTPETDPNFNPFFDSSKTGTNRFSILKWIERYRTCDDNGVKLTLGNGTGRLVTTQSQIDNTNVCTPTHIIIKLGTNDVAQGVGSLLAGNLQQIADAIHAELPNCYVGIAIMPDIGGTFFPHLYPEVKDCVISQHTTQYNTASQILSAFGSLNEDANKTYLLPSYFVQPTAYSLPLREVSLPENDFIPWKKKEDRVLVPVSYFGAAHVSSYAHVNWAYQMYSWIKYTLAS